MRPDYRSLYRFANRMRTPTGMMPGLDMDLAHKLMTEAKWVGTDIAATNDSSGNRKSGTAGGDDRATLMRRNYNWITADPATQWAVANATYVTGTQVDTQIVRAQTAEPPSDVDRKIWGRELGANGDYTFSIQVKSNVVATQSGFIAIVNAGSDTIKSQTNFTATSEWQTINVTGTTDGSTAGVRYNIYGADNTDILYQLPSTVAFASDTAIEFPATSDAGYTKTDLTMFGQIPVIGAFEGRTNLVSTVITSWDASTLGGGTINVTDQGDGVFRVTVTQTAGQTSARVRDVFAGTSGQPYTGAFSMRLINGDPSAMRLMIQREDSPFTQVTKDITLTSEWQNFDISSTITWTANTRLQIDTTEKTVTYEVKCSRCHNSSAPGPAHVDGSGAGDVYATDIVSATLHDNLVSEDLTDWSVGAQATVTEPSDSIYRIACGTGAGRIAFATFANASLDRSGKCEVRLVSGSVTSNTFFGFLNSSYTQVGTAATLEGLTSEWQEYDCSVTSSHASARLAFSCDEEITIEVRFMRATDTAAPVDWDQIWHPQGTIVQALTPYGYSGSANPVSAGAKSFIANAFEVNNTANQTLIGSGGAPSIPSGVAVSEGQVTIEASDWNGIDIGFRVNLEARQTATESSPPSGTLYIANRSAGDRTGHMLVATAKFDRVLSDYEYNAFMVLLETILGSMIIA